MIARKADEDGARRHRPAQQPHRHLGDDAEQSLRADNDAEEIIAGGVELLAAQPDDLAVHQHHLDAEHVVGGEPVFQAMHAARVLGDIAADRAGDLARRIGRVVEAGMLNRVSDAEIGDARLDDGAAIGEIDVEDAVELAETEEHAVGERQGAAGQRGAGAARHDLDAFLLAIAQDARNLIGGLGEDDDHRRLAIGGQAVAFIGAALRLGNDDALAGDDAAQVLGDLRPAGDDACVGLGHAHGRSPALRGEALTSYVTDRRRASRPAAGSCMT